MACIVMVFCQAQWTEKTNIIGQTARGEGITDDPVNTRTEPSCGCKLSVECPSWGHSHDVQLASQICAKEHLRQPLSYKKTTWQQWHPLLSKVHAVESSDTSTVKDLKGSNF